MTRRKPRLEEKQAEMRLRVFRRKAALVSSSIRYSAIAAKAKRTDSK